MRLGAGKRSDALTLRPARFAKFPRPSATACFPRIPRFTSGHSMSPIAT